MTLAEFKTKLDSTGFDARYYHYRTDAEKPSTPYLVYNDLGTSNYYADGEPMFSNVQIEVMLWTTTKDVESENKVIDALGNLYFEQSTTNFDEDSELFYTTFTTNIIQ